MSKFPGKAVTWGAVLCLIAALVTLGLRRTETIGDSTALPVIAVLVVGFVTLTVVAGIRMARRRP